MHSTAQPTDRVLGYRTSDHTVSIHQAAYLVNKIELGVCICINVTRSAVQGATLIVYYAQHLSHQPARTMLTCESTCMAYRIFHFGEAM